MKIIIVHYVEEFQTFPEKRLNMASVIDYMKMETFMKKEIFEMEY